MTNLLNLTEPLYGLTGRALPDGAIEGADDGAYVLLPDGKVNSFDPQMREILDYLTIPRSRSELQAHLSEWGASLEDFDEMVDEGAFWRIDPHSHDDLLTTLIGTRVVVTANAIVRNPGNRIVITAGGTELPVAPASLMALGAGGEGIPVNVAVARAAAAADVELEQAWQQFLLDLGPLLDRGVAYLAAGVD